MNTTSFKQQLPGVLAIASIFALRMTGLFMMLPILSWYALHLTNSNAMLAGLAISIYGLTQALLQIPFGMLSDVYGRKIIIAFGLVLFCLGSFIAGFSDSLIGIILGRACQGAGAIGSTLIAFVADITEERHRAKAMAVVGITIGSSFMLAIVLGSFLKTSMDVPQIFYLSVLLGILAIVILFALTPSEPASHEKAELTATPQLFSEVISNINLLRLDFGIFVQHAILTANFVCLPILFKGSLDIQHALQWKIYLFTLVGSFFIALPLIRIAEMRGQLKPLCSVAILLMAASQFALWCHFSQLPWLIACLYFYFVGFNILEASLPALITLAAPRHCKGTAMGVYSTSQFAGIFCGGTLSGWLLSAYQPASVFLSCAIAAAIWFIITLQLPHSKSSSARSGA